MKIVACASALLLIVAAANFAEGSLRQNLPSPYTYVCEDKKCTKKLKSELGDVNGTTLEVCKITCNDLGTIWPKPSNTAAYASKLLIPLYFSKISLDVNENPEAIMDLLNGAYDIFTSYLTRPKSENDEDVLKNSLKIVLRARSDTKELPVTDSTSTHLESYSLEVRTAHVFPGGNANVEVTISAATFFGIRHGLETLSQFIVYDEDNDVLQIVDDATIVDEPVFAYRGVMLDTSRNYYSIPVLKKLIDGLSYNKLNVFHWHITDSHSFPMEIETVPKMMQYGAYSPEKVYRKSDIVDLVSYARQRGVKVIPELDQPAHSGYGYQWGKEDGLGDLVVCLGKEPWFDYCVEPVCGQLNIVNDNVVEVVGNIFNEMFTMFDNDIFHMGGDEVDYRCYNTTKEVTDWMQANGYSLDSDGFTKLWGNFQEKLLGKLHAGSSRGEQTKAIVWTSTLTDPNHIETYLDKNKYIIQIWSDSQDTIIHGLLEKGYRTIFSNVDALYLDCGYQAWLGTGHNWCSPIKGWQTVYDNDPEKIYAKWANESAAHDAITSGQILGAETPLWSEQADDHALLTRIFPRAAAHGERTWSHPKTSYLQAETRMIANRNRMAARGLITDRLQPEYCYQNDQKCYAELPANA